MNKEELIGKLQMVYVGDKNALNELSGYYDGLKQGIEELQQENQELKAELQLYNGSLKREHEAIHRANDLEERIDKAIEYINKYAWQEDIIGGIYTTTGKPAIDRYMQLEWDNCNELLDILKEVE